MIEGIRREVLKRGIARLCHFTPSRNLVHIASGMTDILSTKKLKEDERSLFTQTDLLRLDGHEDHIACSIEFPNAWYLDKARSNEVLFLDWVVIMIIPKYLWARGTRFSPRNAASNRGRGISEGEAAFLAMFAESIRGAYGRTYARSPGHLLCCPTDEQAEVLIPDRISMNDILGVAVSGETQARNEVARLRIARVPENRFQFIIAPILFDKRRLSTCIRSGRRPPETPWNPED